MAEGGLLSLARVALEVATANNQHNSTAEFTPILAHISRTQQCLGFAGLGSEGVNRPEW